MTNTVPAQVLCGLKHSAGLIILKLIRDYHFPASKLLAHLFVNSVISFWDIHHMPGFILAGVSKTSLHAHSASNTTSACHSHGHLLPTNLTMLPSCFKLDEILSSKLRIAAYSLYHMVPVTFSDLLFCLFHPLTTVFQSHWLPFCT